jgi:hypothetical protein
MSKNIFEPFEVDSNGFAFYNHLGKFEYRDWIIPASHLAFPDLWLKLILVYCANGYVLSVCSYMYYTITNFQ